MKWWEKIKIGLCGTFGGAILTMIIGFNWGGWLEFPARKPYIAEPEISSKFRPKIDGFIA